MGRAYSDITFTPTVREVQAEDNTFNFDIETRGTGK